MITQNLSYYLGTNRTWQFRAWDQTALEGTTDKEKDEALQAAIEAGTAVPRDITGMTFIFVLRSKDTSTGTATLTKTPTVTGAYSATVALNTQRIVLSVTPTDLPQWNGTTGFKPKVVRYSTERADSGFEEIFNAGDFELLPSTSR